MGCTGCWHGLGATRPATVACPCPARATSPGFLRRHRASLLVVALYALLAVVPGLLISELAHPGDNACVHPVHRLARVAGRAFPLPRLGAGDLDPLPLAAAPDRRRFRWARTGRRRRSPRYEGITADAVLGAVGRQPPSGAEVRTLRLSRGGLLALLALAASVATLVIWPPTALPPFNRLVPESDVFWWRVVPAYFWAIWLPLVFVNVYMLVWIVLRQTIMIVNIQRLLRLFAVEPVPFHPDRCSGFAPIGSYATNIVRVALIVGSWALVLLVSGPLTGHGIYVAPHILFLVLVQVLLTPYLLLGPVWYAHRVMREARDRALARVAAQIRACLLASAGRSRHDGRERRPYRELEAKYQLTGEGYHTWPFQPSAVSGVSITAGLTLLGNVAAILYRMYVEP